MTHLRIVKKLTYGVKGARSISLADLDRLHKLAAVVRQSRHVYGHGKP
jgi:hypothetical protein